MEVTLQVRVETVLFSNHNTGGDFGIYSCRPLPNQELGHIQLSSFGNFVVKGVSVELDKNQRATIVVGAAEPDPSGRFDDSYKLVKVVPPELDTIEQQDAYLSSILTEYQFNSIKKEFPNSLLVDMIKKGELQAGMVRGIGESTIEAIKDKIDKHTNHALLISLLQKYGFSINRVGSIAEHFNGDAMQAVKTIENNIYALCEIKGWGFKTVDAIVQSKAIPHSPQRRVFSAIEYVLNQHANEGHTWIDRVEIMNEVSSLTGEDRDIITEQLNDEHFLISKGTPDRVSLKWIAKVEASIAVELKRIHDNAIIEDLEEVRNRIRGIEREQGFEFTDEQIQAIETAHTHGVSVVTGKAGTGKSATIRGIALSTPQEEYLTMALSGRAVDVLSEKQVVSSTVHRTVGINTEPNVKNPFTGESIDPTEQRILILDEFSMPNASLYLSILESVVDGQRLTLVGDIGQLPPIGFGDVARDIIHTGFYPITELTKIHRQALESGIIEFAYAIDNMKQVTDYHLDKPQIIDFGVNKDAKLVALPESEQIIPVLSQILGEFKKNKFIDTSSLIDLQVISPTKERGQLSAKNVNSMMQEMFNPASFDKGELQLGKRLFREGDKVMASGNAYDIPMLNRRNLSLMKNTTTIYNGAIGFIKQIHAEEKRIVIDFPREDGLVIFSKDELDALDLSYCSSVHKLQGSSAKIIIFLIDFASYKLLSKQLAYVGVTRAEESLFTLAENKALHHAISTDASTQRRTYLRELLILNQQRGDNNEQVSE